MERPVGETFTVRGTKFQVVESKTCKGCTFYNENGKLCFNMMDKITGTCRYDGRNVIFKKLK